MSEKFTEDYVRTVHCAYPVSRVLDYIAALEAEVAELKSYRDGYDIKDKLPEAGKPIRIQMVNGHTWSGYIYDPAFEREKIGDNQRITRWWPLPEVTE